MDIKQRLWLALWSALISIVFTTSAATATVSTDRANYPLGSTVSINGSGFHVSKSGAATKACSSYPILPSAQTCS